MKSYTIFYLLLISLKFVFAQNLIPNGSFELNRTFDYEHPQNAFLHLKDWYPANLYTIPTLDNGTPDLFDFKNPVPTSNGLNFWNKARGAADGDFHVGIANHFLYEGYLTPEAFGTVLVKPLEADAYYHISLHFRNKGVDGYQSEPILCVPEGFKQIEMLLDRDSAFLVIDKLNKTSYSNATKKINLKSTIMESTITGSWHNIGTCFQADGGERFFTTTLKDGEFPVEPPCVIHEEHWDVFYVYYFDIDDIRLTKLPEVINVNETVCKNRNKKINIADLANLPIMQNEIQYHWEDGTIDSVNYISQAGVYRIEAILDCTTIPIFLEVKEFACEINTFIPNAFSPNDDGKNDQLKVFINEALPIEEYRFSVYNRWGVRVFSSNDISKNWDGTFQGKPLKDGTYIWLLDYHVIDPEEGRIDYRENGSVLILR